MVKTSNSWKIVQFCFNRNRIKMVLNKIDTWNMNFESYSPTNCSWFITILYKMFYSELDCSHLIGRLALNWNEPSFRLRIETREKKSERQINEKDWNQWLWRFYTSFALNARKKSKSRLQLISSRFAYYCKRTIFK